MVTYIFYNQNIALCSTITMVLDWLGLDHCMDEDKTKSTQTYVILVSFGESMPGNWLYLQATSLTQKMPSLLILNTQLDLMQCQDYQLLGLVPHSMVVHILELLPDVAHHLAHCLGSSLLYASSNVVGSSMCCSKGIFKVASLAGTSAWLHV